MRKLLLGSCALLLSGALAFAANISLQPSTTPLDPANVIQTLNLLIQQMNSQVSGMLAVQVGPKISTAQTAAQVLATTTIATATLNAPGQSLRLKCWGSTPSNADNKWVSLTFGTTVVTSGGFTTANELWQLDLYITAVTPTANYMAVGGARLNNTLTGALSQQVTADNLSTGLTAACGAEQGTAAFADVLMLGFTVEQVK